jgi:putative membrane protein
MEMKKRDWSVYLNIAILTFFTIWFVAVKNYEFLLYTVTLGLLIYILAKTDKIFNYLSLAKWGFTVWLFLHLAGGSFRVAGERLYDFMFFTLIGDPYFILRYDQVIHAFCYFVITLFVFSMVMYVSRKKIHPFLIGLIAVLASMGISAMNEIIEFSTVAFFQAIGVGNYFNNALDLVFNLIGAGLALVYV